MRGKLWFLGGLAAGFVLGARAGREKYEEIMSTARKVKEHPTVQEARGVVQEQANRLLSEGKDKLSQTRFAETKVGGRLLSGSETKSTPAAAGTTSLGSSTDSTLATTGSTTRSNSAGTGTTSSDSSY
jgi:hypothetical protein